MVALTRLVVAWSCRCFLLGTLRRGELRALGRGAAMLPSLTTAADWQRVTECVVGDVLFHLLIDLLGVISLSSRAVTNGFGLDVLSVFNILLPRRAFPSLESLR